MKKIKIIFENNDFVVVNKPAGVLAHPTQAKETNTLVQWLIETYPNVNKLAWPEHDRLGIVHRLDKDTSGVMILAKNPETLVKLQELFKAREVKKTYQALVLGQTPAEGKIEAAIVRDAQKDQMKVQETTYSFTKGTVRPAVTFYKTIRLYAYSTNYLSLVEAMPQTGRMHQIRVHLKYLGFPILGDPMYFTKESKKISQELGINRQFLHAIRLEFENHKFESNLAGDLQQIINSLS